MNKKRGIPCIALGIVISVLGVFPIVAGIIIDNSDYYYNYQFDNLYRNDFFWNLPKILLIAGAVTIFIGLMLLILGVVLYSTSGSKTPAVNYNQNNIPAPVKDEAAKSSASNHCAIIDENNCLTEFQKIGLLSRLGDFKSKTNYGIAIYIKRDDFSEELFKSAYNFYKTKALGQSCVILMISAANSKMFISTMDNCRRFINDRDKERIYNTLSSYVRSGQYYDACIEFIDAALDCVNGANKQSTAPQFNSLNTSTAAPLPVVSDAADEEQEIDNINPYLEEKPQTAQTPAQPINAESYMSAQPQTEAQESPCEEPAAVSAEPQNNFCTACGAPIGKDDKFCAKCGNKLI